MVKKLQEPPDEDAGDLVKNRVDRGMAGIMRRLWKGVQQVGAGSFLKGAAITGALVIGVMALVAGSMGAAGSLSVSGNLITTFEGGFGAGIDAALKFITSGLGIGTLVAGGLVATASDIVDNQRKQAALESERLALEYRRTHEHQKERHHTRSHHHTTVTKETNKHHETEHKSAPKENDSLYVKGSITKTDKWFAAELKRRTERETEVTI